MDEISVGFVTYFSVAMIMLPLFQVLHKKKQYMALELYLFSYWQEIAILSNFSECNLNSISSSSLK